MLSSKNMSAPALWTIVAVAAATTSQPLKAGGLYVREFGQPSQGMSGAGANVLAVDASTAFQNPAGLFQLRKDTNWMVTGISLISEIEFDVDSGSDIQGSDGGDAGDVLFGGAAFFTHRFDERWGAAFSLNSFSGSAVDYGSSFSGRYLGFETELLTVSALPSIAYRFNKSFSAALGVALQYGELDLFAAVPPLLGPALPERDGRVSIEDGDDYAAALTVSGLWQVSNRVRVGMAWLGQRDLNFDSDLSLELPGAGGGTGPENVATNVEIVFPQVVSMSASWQTTEQLMLTSRLAWEEWSALDAVPVYTSNAGATIGLDWKDVWSLALGLQYKPGGRFTWYTGVAYDSDPADAQSRLPVLPPDEQWRLSGGMTYALNETRSVGLTATYIDLGDAQIDSTSDVGTFSGSYQTNRLLIVGLSFEF